MWDIDLNVIYEATRTIKAYCSFSKFQLFDLCRKVADVLCLWTGNNWIGIENDTQTKKAFQDFFLALNELISNHRISKNKMERSLSEHTLYEGTIYRYIGAKQRKDSAPEVICDGIYVSWSKDPYNTYILDKIQTKCTWIKCEVVAPMFGIDVEGFEIWYRKHIDKRINIAKGTEREIVFPTIKDYIVGIVKPFKCNKWAKNGYSCECCRTDMEYSEFLECSKLEG